ncbi:MAG TPA: SAM-dependent methyltransferase, partial [Polyangiales bacterium]
AISRLVTLTSEFVFALCQRGAEVALKREAQRKLPGYAPAYQRPGLVTFRAPEPITPEVELPLAFARASGMSLGAARDASAALERVRGLRASQGLGRVCLQVVERELFRADEEPPGFTPCALAKAQEGALRGAAPELFSLGLTPEPGELVLSAIVAPDDPWVLGLHRHQRGRCPYPGGRYPVHVPDHAPSRAYAKLEESVRAFELPLWPRDVALELGAAPGGAALALLQRGVDVIGVDPGAMDPFVLGFTGPDGARLRHVHKPMGALARNELPQHVDWLLLDVHLAPQVALRTARKVASWFRDSLSGAVLTLKLNDWAFADQLDSFLAQAQEMGLVAPRARQFASHRQELCIVGLTNRGRARLR